MVQGEKFIRGSKERGTRDETNNQSSPMRRREESMEEQNIIKLRKEKRTNTQRQKNRKERV